jgi:uncharacterized protein (UPF0548 family)
MGGLAPQGARRAQGALVGRYGRRVTHRRDELTYAEVGATETEALPAGYRHVRRRVQLGKGREVFAAVAAGMRAWGIHRQARLRLRTEAGSPRVGTDFSAGVPLLAWTVWVPCRVVWVRDAATGYGYGFGTVRGHPESGEEAFAVSIDDVGRVWFDLRAFSRPATRTARLGGPVAAFLQRRITDRYVAAARSLGSPDAARSHG